MIKFGPYFRIALLLPLAIGALSWFASIDSPLFILWLSIRLDGFPYLVFAIILGIWSKKQSDKKLMITTSVIPVIFIPFATAGIFLYSAPPYSIANLSDAVRVSVTFGMGIGYFYVVTGWLVYISINFFYKIFSILKNRSLHTFCNGYDL